MRTRNRLIVLCAAMVAVGAVAVPTGAFAGGSESSDSSVAYQRRCARQFDAAIQQDMETFVNYDLEGWRDVHDPDAVTIFVGGRVEVGFDNIAAALHTHFEAREAVFTFTELTRNIEGCRTGYIVYDATYAIPRVNFSQRQIIGVTYNYQRGRWLVVADQNTLKTP